MKMAGTLLAHRRGILAWYDCHISTGKVEGINNKIKVMKRNAYGFRDDRYFTLRLYALHDCRITRNVGWTQKVHPENRVIGFVLLPISPAELGKTTNTTFTTSNNLRTLVKNRETIIHIG